MGRRRRRKIRRKQRRIIKPGRYFQCPMCGSLTLTVDIKTVKVDGSKERLAIVKCGSCKLYCERTVSDIMERVDVYNMISDLVYEGRYEEECGRASADLIESGGEGAEVASEEGSEEAVKGA